MSLNMKMCGTCEKPIKNEMNHTFDPETLCQCVGERSTYFKYEKGFTWTSKRLPRC